MTSINQQRSNEGTDDAIVSIPSSDIPEAISSQSASDQHHQMSISPGEALEGVFDIKVVDIAKDGAHHFPDGGFDNQDYSDSQLTALIEAAPKDKLRVLIAEQAKFGSSRKKPLGWMSEETRNDAEKLESKIDLVWEPHDPALFRRLLRYCLGDQHTAFWAKYDCWTEHRDFNSYEILLKWRKVSSEYLVGLIVFDGADMTSSGRTSFLQWLSKHQTVSATCFGDYTIQVLGRLFVMDIISFITSREIAQLKLEIDCIRHVENWMDDDGLPKTDGPDYQIDMLSDRITALLENLNLSTSTRFRAESTDPLDSSAEDLVVRLEFMKRCVRQMKEMHHGRLDGHITRSNSQESRAVKRLAILASVFLPLSLGAGILSMQNRFVDIHLILWDFVAIGVDMGLLAFIFFQITASRGLLWVKFAYSRIIYIHSLWYQRSRRNLEKRNKLERQLETLVWEVLGLPGLIALVTVLNLGVFGNIQYAWKILVCGLAGGVGIYVLLMISYMITIPLLNRYNRRFWAS